MSRLGRAASFASFVLACTCLTAPASAQVVAQCDTTTSIATIDGMIEADEYPGVSIGVGMGFMRMIGMGIPMHLDSHEDGRLAVAIDGTGGMCAWGANDSVVIYLDVLPDSGFASTAGFTDNGDPGRAAISGMGTSSGRADLTFAAGFTADHAIVLRADSASLFELREGAHRFISSLTRSPAFDTSCVREAGGFTMADLGSQAGNPIHWVATLLNSENAFRSNEFQGVAATPMDNIGAAPHALTAGDRNIFATYGPPISFEGSFAWIDFGAYAGAGFTPTPNCGQLSSNNYATTGWSDGALAFGGTRMTGDHARGVPTVVNITTGGFYSLSITTNDVAFMFQPGGGDFEPGTLTLRLQNTTASVITAARIAYEVWIRNDQLRSNNLSFSWSTDDVTYTPVPAITVTSTAEADAAPVPWVRTPITTMLSGLSIPAGGHLYLRFSSAAVGGSGSRDEFALDDIVVAPTYDACGNGTLDAGELCDAGVMNGTTTCGCQNDCTFAANGLACGGGAGGACDAPDSCDGMGACVDAVLSMGAECRPSAGPCDVVDRCDGLTAVCPMDAVRGMGEVCSAADPGEICDAADTCDGSSTACAPRFAVGVPCRPSSGLCDLGAMCDGTSLVCPASMAASAGTPCRTSTGACDLGASCDGTLTCPASMPASAGTPCRTSTGACDLGASCDGTLTCPASMPASVGTPCRASTGVCDLGAVCGGALSCPASTPAVVGTPCRASAGDCDVVESCDGTITCPADGFMMVGTPCRTAASVCDAVELCAGAATCPPDLARPDGASCADALACNGAEICTGGVCGAPDIDCSDSDLCTAEMCMEPGGTCTTVRDPSCCNVSADCEDGDVCTLNTCSGPGGTCSTAPITNCCDSPADCTDSSACTTDTCVLATNRCSFTPIPDCCTSASDCGDGNVCTTDACGPGGACSNVPIDNCCVSDGDCADGDACTTNLCGADNRCAFAEIADCCDAPADCDDGDICTSDTCGADERCAFPAIANCCEAPADCDDGDACTTNLCGADNRCAFAEIADCCDAPADCDDGDACTMDACTASECVYTDVCTDGGMPDGGMSDAGMDDAGMSDAGMDDAGMSDAGMDDGGMDDGGMDDGGMDDGGMDDAGTDEEDAGGDLEDAGSMDGGEGGISGGACGCRATGTSGAPWWIAIVIALVWRRRKRA
jgi:hypothetical protein